MSRILLYEGKKAKKCVDPRFLVCGTALVACSRGVVYENLTCFKGLRQKKNTLLGKRSVFFLLVISSLECCGKTNYSGFSDI